MKHYLDHPFFVQPWRRHLTVAVCVLWGLFELSTGAVGWAVFTFAIGAFAQWQFSRVDWAKYDEEA